jgi:oxygen-independent coproporphyrinogen III oxidase
MILPHDPPTGEDAALDLDLIRKYAIPGPRYTSYPPANKFRDRLPELDLDAAIAADNQDPNRPLSLYFHLPFCQSRCWYCGCTTIITRRQDWATTYLAELKKEIALVASRLDLRRPVEQLHFGGGTPTFFSADSLRELGEVLHQTFRFAPDAECSIEIDPRVVTPEQVQVLADLGINRASLGIQDTNTEVQTAIHRVQPSDLNVRAVQLLRAAGINDINLDLIYGLPRQTVTTVEQTVADVLALSPDRLSVFSYAHVPWIKPAQRIFDKRGQMPGPEDKLAMFGVIRRGLMAAGFVDVGLDHFARPDDPLAIARREGSLHRNFQGYSTRAGASLYAFGISSISSSPDAYWQNPKSLAAYREALNAGRLPAEKGYRLTAEDKRRRRLIMGIMCDRGLDFEQLGREWNCRITSAYASELASLEDLRAEGLVTWDEAGLTVTPRGEPLLRVVAMAFDQTLVRQGKAHALTV